MNTADVLIVGGGPAGLMLAIELGCRGVNCVVLEEDLAAPDFPKANATSSRTMEHYRRRGFAKRVRALGLAADHPQDIIYGITLAGRELARFSIPSREQVAARTAFGDYGEESWPTPELPHRGQQMYIEPVLREQALTYPSVKLLLGLQAQAIVMDDHGVTVTTRHAVTHQHVDYRAAYVVGCDGPRSLVRKSCGISYSGLSEEARDFFGGQMVSVYFRSASLYSVLDKKRAWQYWAVNTRQRGLLVSINGVDEFLFCLQLQSGQTIETVDVDAAMFAAIGKRFDYQLIATGPWQAGFTLVADRFGKGRAFIAGDAAHLFTPTGGMGYNTSVDDAVNLGWKLAAVLQGWAPPALLDTYEAERKPIAHRNTTFARSMADSIGRIRIPDQLEADDAAGAAARVELAAALSLHVRTEFNIPGLQLGLRYEGSPIVARDPAPPTPDEPNTYIPSGRPGGRAPHFWMDGQSIFDLLGRDFTLVCFGPDGQALHDASVARWQMAASAAGIPLAVLHCPSAEGRTLYGADCALIRPDHHIAWRGSADANAGAVLQMACSPHPVGAGSYE